MEGEGGGGNLWWEQGQTRLIRGAEGRTGGRPEEGPDVESERVQLDGTLCSETSCDQ